MDMIIRASLPFAAFVLWLLSVPMDGFLPAMVGVNDSLLYFLIPHIVSLALIGTVIQRTLLSPLASFGGFLSIVSTLLIIHATGGAHWSMAMAGVGSAFLCVKAAATLKRSPNVALSAALGLAAANLLLFLFMEVPLPVHLKSYGAAALLLIPMFVGNPEVDEGKGDSTLWSFLPFVFVFQIVSGLMYGALYGAYGRAAFLPGIELLFYIAAVAAGLLLIHRRREALLVLGILSAMFAFSLFLMGGELSVNVSFYAMQVAAGFIDFYLLLLFLAQHNSLRAFGTGLAVNCAGIASGKGISLVTGEASNLVAAVANMVLTSSVLLLYLLMRSGRGTESSRLQAKGAMAEMPDTAPDDGASPQPGFVLPYPLRKRFSEQEKSVLACIARGMTFRETARELVISESSVKTYMKRIYDKMSVSGKDELLAKLGEEPRN